jgi:hypothetical protein
MGTFTHKHIPDFDKPIDELLCFSKQTRKAVTFSRFEKADKCVDAVIISRTKSEYPNVELDKVGEVRLISSFTYFPLLFLDNDISEFYFYPAKISDTGFEYDEKVFLPLENGRNMRAEYSMVQFKPIPVPEEKKKKSIFPTFGNKKPTHTPPPEYQCFHIHIRSKNEKVLAKDFWYKIKKINDEKKRVPALSDNKKYTLNDIKYPVPPFKPNDKTNEYESIFEVFVKPGDYVALRCDDTRVTLTNTDRGSKSSDGGSQGYGTRTVIKNQGPYPIYCTYFDCLEEIESTARLARLSPPVDVLDLISAFNVKKEGFSPGVEPEAEAPRGFFGDEDDDLYTKEDEEEDSEESESEKSEEDEDKKALEEWKETLSEHERNLLNANELIFLEIRNILFENSFEASDLKKTLKLIFYYFQALWKKRTGEFKYQNIDSYDDTNIVSLSIDIFFAAEEANKLTDVKDRHGCLVEEFLCPKCYAENRLDKNGKPRELVRNHGVNETVFISLLGATSAGKTVYLAKTMYSYFKENHPINNGLVAIPSPETNEYLNKVIDELKSGDKIVATSEIQRLTYEIMFRGVAKNVIIYDIPGETLFSNSMQNRIARIGTIRNIYERANIVLFIFPIDHAEVEGAIKRPEGVPTFMNLMMIINQQVFQNSAFTGKNTAFILSKIDKLKRDYGGSDIRLDALPNPGETIEKTLELEGVETSLEFYTAYSNNDELGQTEAIKNVLKTENELTEDFFKNVLKKDYNFIKSIFTPDKPRPQYFSYGTPDGDINNKNKIIPAVRPFNSIQWIIGNLFPPENL